MKKIFLSFGTLGFALAAPGQPAVSQPPRPEAMNAYSVASPNRVRSAELANVTRRDKHRHKHHHHTDGPDALAWVDATGKTVGRLYDEFSMVVPFNNEQALVYGVGGVPCDTSCTDIEGVRWLRTAVFYYQSSDCSGLAYSPIGGVTTPYAGYVAAEGGTTYIYFFKMRAMAPVALKSIFTERQCQAFQSRPTPDGTQLAAPLVGAIPASAFGIEPFMLK
jgi:hypothetical protein